MPLASLSWRPHLTFQKRQRKQVPLILKITTINITQPSVVSLMLPSSASRVHERAYRLTVCIAYRLSTTRHARPIGRNFLDERIAWEASCEIDDKSPQTDTAVPLPRALHQFTIKLSQLVTKNLLSRAPWIHPARPPPPRARLSIRNCIV